MTRIEIGIGAEAPPRTASARLIDRMLGMLLGDATAAFHAAGFRHGRLVTLHQGAELDLAARRQGYLA